MDETEQIRTGVLRSLYLTLVDGQPLLTVDALAAANGWDRSAMYRVLEYLTFVGAIKRRDSGTYKILGAGVAMAEEEGVTPPEMVAASNAARFALLEEYERYLREIGRHGAPHYREVCRTVVERCALEERLVRGNHEVLEGLGALEDYRSSGSSFITDLGLRCLATIKERDVHSIAFDALSRSSATPQRRGMEFQHLLGRLAEHSGFQTSEGVKNPGEELDLVLHYQDRFYLVECRWTKTPIEAKAMRDFRGKLRKRPAVEGLFASMSGFADGAQREANDEMNERLVLLLGPQDIRALFTFTAELAQMIAEKRQEAIMHRRAVWA
jgi:hypothetical protein